MALRTAPLEPSPGMYYTIERRVESGVFESWEKFLPGFRSNHALEYGRSLSSS
jgi:hypothetical protein